MNQKRLCVMMNRGGERGRGEGEGGGKKCFQKRQDPERFVQPIRVERLRIS
jgi:hypothetical protein